MEMLLGCEVSLRIGERKGSWKGILEVPCNSHTQCYPVRPESAVGDGQNVFWWWANLTADVVFEVLLLGSRNCDRNCGRSFRRSYSSGHFG
jgi:hypothetical protein